MRKAMLIAVAAAAVVPAFFWLGGFNFDGRGVLAVMCAFYTLLVGGAAFVVAKLS